jgi:formylglycine-generating enzyme required for sulfatase activity
VASLVSLDVVAIPSGRVGAVSVAAFSIGRTPVVNASYAPFLGAGRAPAPPWWDDPAFRAPSQPVVGVTWDEAVGFAEWLSEKAGGKWRLPTEEEWEHAMRGGLDDPPTPWGEKIPPGEIPEGPLAGPWEAGLGTPNGYGILDPGTSVHEWCLDWFEPAIGAAGPRRRASRGGSWRHAIRWSRPSARSSLPPNYRYSDYGFRVVRETGEERSGAEG